MKIEVVVYNIESARNAAEGGADRIELCDNPGEGGTTPSLGVIATVKQEVNLEVYIMIRPRGGDFCYTDQEFRAMREDISQCKQLGVDGVVLGILTSEGVMDKERCKELIDLAKPLSVTCHRAFDMTINPFEALEDCVEVGFDTILTSGQQAKAIDGISLIAELIKRSSGRISIMPGSGVNEETVEQIVSGTGAKVLHISATSFRESPMFYKNSFISGMGSDTDAEYRLRSVDPQQVRKIRALAEEAGD